LPSLILSKLVGTRGSTFTHAYSHVTDTCRSLCTLETGLCEIYRIGYLEFGDSGIRLLLHIWEMLPHAVYVAPTFGIPWFGIGEGICRNKVRAGVFPVGCLTEAGEPGRNACETENGDYNLRNVDVIWSKLYCEQEGCFWSMRSQVSS
jgi:hypothetical protein